MEYLDGVLLETFIVVFVTLMVAVVYLMIKDIKYNSKIRYLESYIQELYSNDFHSQNNEVIKSYINNLSNQSSKINKTYLSLSNEMKKDKYKSLSKINNEVENIKKDLEEKTKMIPYNDKKTVLKFTHILGEINQLKTQIKSLGEDPNYLNRY